jgi:Pao retrotransposon peptidase
MVICKITSNDEAVRNSIPHDKKIHISTDDDDPQLKTLGIKWHVKTDLLRFQAPTQPAIISKRSTLSLLYSLFDPLGLLTPYILQLRLLFRDICKGGRGLDIKVESSLQTQWIKSHDHLTKIGHFNFPRYIGPIENRNLWMFADASPLAYGCVSYLESPGCNKMILLHSKGKLSPKSITNIPYLELKALELMTKWLSVLLKTYPALKKAEIYLCSDFQIALQWVSTGIFQK